MKHIKKFDSNRPKVGDYVICDCSNLVDILFESFLKTHIGRIVDIDDRYIEPYVVIFYDTDKNDPKYLELEYTFDLINNNKYDPNLIRIRFVQSEIKYYSNNKDELKIKLDADIYNL